MLISPQKPLSPGSPAPHAAWRDVQGKQSVHMGPGATGCSTGCDWQLSGSTGTASGGTSYYRRALDGRNNAHRDGARHKLQHSAQCDARALWWLAVSLWPHMSVQLSCDSCYYAWGRSALPTQK